MVLVIDGAQTYQPGFLFVRDFVRRYARYSTVLRLVGLALLPFATGCSSAVLSGASSSSQGGTHITVKISPVNSMLSVGQQEQFAAAVTGTPNREVSWSVSGSSGSNAAAGTISASGLYTAPPVPPAGGTITIQAISVEDNTVTATATVTVIGTMTISPVNISVPLNGVQQFTAMENNASSPGIEWQVNGIEGGNAMVGTITDSGLYQAPATVPSSTVHVSAIDPKDSIVNATAAVTVFDPAVIAAHNAWLAGLQQAAASYGCSSVSVQQQSAQTVNDAIAEFARTGTEGSCLALWPVSTDTSMIRYSFSWGGLADGKDILYLSDVGQMRIWNGAEADSTASDQESTGESQ